MCSNYYRKVQTAIHPPLHLHIFKFNSMKLTIQQSKFKSVENKRDVDCTLKTPNA